ncbi:MAG: cell filamentation protein Fic [Candidatus Pacebacteria bacterium CG10_big_fil_rev_8_21_14_0_10_42_12]|nr:MAG: cell filamentation protein Fic [Candidatus Pacebacteria bacterium CG10_big_fil_rev_8_21_14_0_10_42_12]
MSTFIKIPDPQWGSNLANVVLDLERLRHKQLLGEIPPHIFFQLKDIFHILETLGSARIEGNNTTLAEYVEKLIEQKAKPDEKQREVQNINRAIDFVEENTDEQTVFTRAYISELHKTLTKDLTPPPQGEGSKSPGSLRSHNVMIKKSNHIPPDYAVLQDYLDGFLEFVNHPHVEQYQLLAAAVAHHRFAYIHPFDNGNGRLGRLLNYAFLIKLGFKVNKGRIINPSSVFYSNREMYYDKLGQADSLENADVLSWCEYFLQGLKNEIEKIDSLLGKDYVKNIILIPALAFSLDRKIVTQQEHAVLKYLVSKPEMQMKSAELSQFGVETSLQKSRFMMRLRDKKMITSTKKGGRFYTVSFVNNYLLRGVIKSLEDNGFVSEFLSLN